MSYWTPAQLAGLGREEALKQRMRDEGVDPADPAEREAWEAEHSENGECAHCKRSITLDTSAPEDEQVWRDDWQDADCPESPDGLHDPDTPAESSISLADVQRIVDEWYARYSGFSRIDEDTYLALRNRLIPLTPGQPVQFHELGQRRWLNGTLDGPVDNPDDPLRNGDVYVTARSGRRVAVFLSSVRPS